jgi:predicted  nucleic acid-binding Zn-ribbon protein
VSIIDSLLIVQGHDRKIKAFEAEMRDIPAKKNTVKSRLEDHKNALAAAEEELKQKQADVKELELESESKQNGIAKLRQQQLEIKTNKEFKAIDIEIKVLEDQISALEDNELVLMESVESARENVAEKKEDLSKEEAEVSEEIKELDIRISEVEQKLKDVQELREVAAKDVDTDWLRRYEGISVRRDEALVRVEDGVCGGCHMRLPRYIVHDARKQKDMVLCDFCGRLLY